MFPIDGWMDVNEKTHVRYPDNLGKQKLSHWRKDMDLEQYFPSQFT